MTTAVVLKSDPFSWKAIQAFKIASALSKRCKVYFITIKEGCYFLKDWNPEELEYENFKSYDYNPTNLLFVADKDDFSVRGLDRETLWVDNEKLTLAEEEEIGEILKTARVVGVW